MNKMTQDISKWLKIDLETALKVQNEMACFGVHFGNSSLATLKREAKIALQIIKMTHQ